MKFTLFIFLIFSLNVFGQSKIWREYSKKTDFCSTSLKLYKDSTYFYETGCEGRSNINIGRWALEKGIIQLEPYDTMNYNCIKTIYKRPYQTTNPFPTITILDKNKELVENFDIAFIPDSVKGFWHVNFSPVYVALDTSIYPVPTDKNGMAKFPDAKSGELILFDSRIFGKAISFYIPNNELQDIVIELNVIKEIFIYPELKWIVLPKTKLKDDKKEMVFIDK